METTKTKEHDMNFSGHTDIIDESRLNVIYNNDNNGLNLLKTKV